MTRRSDRATLNFTDHGGAKPFVGLYLVTLCGRSAYLVESCRPIRRRTPGPPKYAPVCLRVDPDEARPFSPIRMRWDPRERKV